MKKRYTRPQITQITIDKSISLVMMSNVLGNGNGQGGGWGAGGKPKGAAQATNTQLNSNPFESNPFQ
ncbi:hypothetical protein KEM09_00475 [Carboxylicivirga mesophila]|uniref:Paeninodin family lasso peptide n=1 Tax=Carboxylicivirga mesophila TaxID=1166478 RepID=A0ABS5K5P0_9BACT|nr:hypothetical protein [Carboxylicivirga mesophila]MBS2209858.1 hypothetical protein [Carboxylicivirga mesophila]